MSAFADITMSNMGGFAYMKIKHWKIFLAAGLAAAVCYVILCTMVEEERTLPGMRVNGIPAGGKTQEEVVELLEKERTECCENAIITVTAADSDYKIKIGDGLDVDCKAFAKKMLRPGKRAFGTRGIFLLRSLLGGYRMELRPELEDTKAVGQAIEDSGILETATTTQTGCVMKDGQLIFTMGEAKDDTVDEEKLMEKIVQAVKKGEYKAAFPCPLMQGEVAPVDLDEVVRKVCVEPANATLDPQNGYEIKEAVTGISFDRELAQKKLDEAEEGSQVVVDLIYTEPEISTQDLREHLFKDLLSTYTTQAAGVSNRTRNISLAAEKCNGIILLADDVFSFNNTVGEQKAETGYYMANGILNGQIVQVYGGGICQVSSTIFAAALYADREIVERWNHDFVSSYIPAGVDAAVAWGALDFQFANNNPYPLKIEVAYVNGNLTVNLWGTKTDDAIVELATETVKDEPGSDLEIQTYRYVYNGDKSQMFAEKVAYSTYLH